MITRPTIVAGAARICWLHGPRSCRPRSPCSGWLGSPRSGRGEGGGAWLALAIAGALASLPAGAAALEPTLVERRIELPGPTGRTEPVMLTYLRKTEQHDPDPGSGYAIVVALHGLGEARRGLERGFVGWNRDYALPDAFRALARGRLMASDYRGLDAEPRMSELNASLAVRPLSGLVVVTPYTPDLITVPIRGRVMDGYADWLAGPLLRRVRQELPFATNDRDRTGIDGVSLGGWVALAVGLRRADAFGRVGGIQPAVRGRVEALARLRRETRGPIQRYRLLTSDHDPFRDVTRELASALRADGAAIELSVLSGPHAYRFNRGPGAIELLFFHGAVAPPIPSRTHAAPAPHPLP